MTARVLLEVCVDSLQSATAAVHGGADRLELCSNLGHGGGTTPSLGLFQIIHKELPDVPIMVMIRPRTGDFVYDETEIQVMIEDIRLFQAAGVHGFVFGLLNPDGSINEANTSRLLSLVEGQQGLHLLSVFIGPLIWPLQHYVTQVKLRMVLSYAMTEVITSDLGVIARLPRITRILTSGQGRAAPLSLQNIQECVHLANAASSGRSQPLSILPGSGLNAHTIKQVAEVLIPTGVHEFHMSGGSWVNGSMEFRKENMGMGVGGLGEWGVWRTSKEEVMNVRRVLDAYNTY